MGIFKFTITAYDRDQTPLASTVSGAIDDPLHRLLRCRGFKLQNLIDNGYAAWAVRLHQETYDDEEYEAEADEGS